MTKRIYLAIKEVNGKQWGVLNNFGPTHLLCAETFKVVEQSYSFAGQHRVRLLRLKKNVHWLIPEAHELDITDVQLADPPRRQR